MSVLLHCCVMWTHVSGFIDLVCDWASRTAALSEHVCLDSQIYSVAECHALLHCVNTCVWIPRSSLWLSVMLHCCVVWTHVWIPRSSLWLSVTHCCVEWTRVSGFPDLVCDECPVALLCCVNTCWIPRSSLWLSVTHCCVEWTRVSGFPDLFCGWVSCTAALCERDCLDSQI